MSMNNQESPTCAPELIRRLQAIPFVRVTPEGDVLIPSDKLDDFVRRYLELTDSREHMERLLAYVREDNRCDPSGSAD
ncbi:hypothetical protein [Fundidesulfovibrio agrisoli]|uniref:hypothetical protein n=1 Tax=Fundidesulfovibrio agrisoli TaxID=2922717 RepID=UPI001FADC265|nr:hypothetical protein [Fundidesulfovibrio agrisoli]